MGKRVFFLIRSFSLQNGQEVFFIQGSDLTAFFGC